LGKKRFDLRVGKMAGQLPERGKSTSQQSPTGNQFVPTGPGHAALQEVSVEQPWGRSRLKDNLTKTAKI